MTSHAGLLSRGWEVHQAGDHAAAERLYRQALALAPDDANTWCHLGMALHDRGLFRQAEAAYRRAIELRPAFPVAFHNLGNTLRALQRFDEALAHFEHALRLKPDYVGALNGKGGTLFLGGRFDEACICFERARELAPDDARAHENLAILWLLQGKFDRAWEEYEWRFKLYELVPEYSQPRWDGSSLDGRTILLIAEQGLGDTLQFVRYAAVLKARYDCQVILQCPRALLPLLATCPGIDCLVSKGDSPDRFDVWIPLLSIPGILRQTPETFPAEVPYLQASPELVSQWKDELDRLPGLKVGLFWQGKRDYLIDFSRSVPLAEMAPLGTLRGLQLIGLQKGDGIEQLDTLAGRLDVDNWGDRIDESSGAFMDTAAILTNLDLLITPDSSVGHLAGALGVPVWIVLSTVPHWPWMLDRGDSPWYPSARLFRQSTANDWAGVFDRIATELCRLSPRIERKQPEHYRVATSGHNRLTRTRHGLLLYNRHDKYIGRSLDRYGEFSDGEFDLLAQGLRPGGVIVEAGANVGAHTLPLAKCVGAEGRVYAFEPQRPIFHCLCANMAINSITNTRCYCKALGAELGELHVPVPDYDAENNFGAVEVGARAEGARAEGARAEGARAEGERVTVVTVDSLNLTRCDLIKADVEGMELEVLRGASATIEQFQPVLYLENDRPDRSAGLIEHVLGLGYNLYWHLPRLFNPNNFFGNRENEFGEIVSANMLGVHSSVRSSISGLRSVEGPQSDWKSR